MARDLGLRVQLEVVRVKGYRRDQQWEDTRLDWHAPSPNLKSARSALLYPAVGVLEGTNVSVGRGTEAPFEQLGAPYIDGGRLAAALRAGQLPGVAIVATHLLRRATGPFAARRGSGVLLSITDRRPTRLARTALALIAGCWAKGWVCATDALFGHKRSWSALNASSSSKASLLVGKPSWMTHARRNSAAVPAVLAPTIKEETTDEQTAPRARMRGSP